MKLSFTILAFLLSFSLQIFAQTEIYVSDAANFENGPWQILKFDEEGKNGKIFISENLGWPQDILFLEEQNIVLISNLTTNRISKYDIKTGVFIGDFATAISGPTRMKIGKDGLLYVLQWNGNGKMKRYDLNGNFIDNFTNIGVDSSIGLDWDKQGNSYISSYNGGYVEKFDIEGKSQGKFITGLLGPTNIYFDEDGFLFVLDYNSGKIKKFDSNGIFVANFINNVPQCEGVGFLNDDRILIGVGGTSRVKMFDKEGNFISDLITSQTLGLKTPNAVVIRSMANSTVEKNVTKSIFRQSIGRYYEFASDLDKNRINKISLLNTNGEFVTNIPLVNKNWMAENLVAGIYFVKAFSKQSDPFIQKIVIH